MTTTRVLALAGAALALSAMAVLWICDRETRPRLTVAAWAWFAVGLVLQYAALIHAGQVEREQYADF